MLSMYPAIFYKEQDGTYAVVFPDLNHLSTCGDDMNEAMSMAIDCLAGYLFTEKLDGRAWPESTPLEKVDVHAEDDEDDDYAEVFANLVSVDVEAYARKHFSRAVKKTLSIPQWMNDMAVRRKINFSRVLQNALSRELGVSYL